MSTGTTIVGVFVPASFADPPGVGGGTAVEVGTTAPVTINGSALWHNTTPGYEGLYFYDVVRAKWLDTALNVQTFGHDSSLGDYLITTGLLTGAEGKGPLIPFTSTIVGVSAFAAGGMATAAIEVSHNPGTVVSMFALAANEHSDMTRNDDLPLDAVLRVRTDGVGTASTDLSVSVYTRRRAA